MRRGAPLNKRLLFFSFLLGLATALRPPPLQAEEIFYDRYAPLWREGPLKKSPSKSAEAFQDMGKHFLVYPFELVRWPVDQTLVYVEEHHLYDKVSWIYERVKDFGVTPRVVKGSSVRDGFGGGFDLELVKLARLKERFPDLTVETSSLWTIDYLTAYGAKIRQDKIASTGFFAGGNFKYENRGEEHFYGVGPHTSLGDGTSYRMERTVLESFFGYEFLNTWNLKGIFGYRNVNITNGEDGGRGIIDEIFVATGRQRIPGLSGDQILSGDVELEHDNRDSKDVPTEGGYERFRFGFNKGLENDSGYFKYRGEAAHFFKLFSDRRVLAFRGVVESNDELGGRQTPFFEMARLGGYGTYPRYGEVHRGYRRDRFYDESVLLFNMEYRWAAWEYRNLVMDSVLFSDVGQVFGEWRDFQFSNFRVSYGLGFRVSLEKSIVVGLEIARANEGTEFYVTTKAPF